MKITKNIKTLLFALPFILFTACSQDTVEDVPMDKSDEMNLSLRMAVPAWTDISTRAGVSTADIGISAGSMQLLCFDSNGFYVGMGTQVVLTPSDDFNGKMTAKVPSSTSRIHFIANAGLTDNAEWLGMYENTLITKLTAKENDEMVYWGYVKKSSASEMKTFLESGSNTVYMLRNEAAVSIVNNDNTISNVVLMVCNDANIGTLAPFNQKDLTEPFGYDSNGPEVATIPSTAGIRTIPTGMSSSHTDTEQFIFESKNTLTQPVRVILRVTYTNGAVRYHKIQLINSKYEFYTIRRNHKYQINIKYLDPEVGYTTFTQALNGNPSNNSLVNVDDIIPTITDYGNHTLSITDANGKETNTSVIYNTTGTKTVYFTYSGDNSMTASDFSVSWLDNDGISPKESLKLTYSNGKGTITFPIYHIDSNLQYGKITLLDTKNGLRRNVKVYAVSPFKFNASLYKGKPSSGSTSSSTYVLTSTTGIKYTTTGTKTISFTYSGDNSMTASNFSVSVSGKYASEDIKNASVSYSNGKGLISFNLAYVYSFSYFHYTFTLKDTKHNQSVEILICGYSGTDYHTHTETEVSSNGSSSSSSTDDGTYTLSFTIPENYPEELLPVTVKFTTNDFNPTDPTLDVVVEDTKTETGKDWNFWYEYKATETGQHNLTLTPSRTSSTGGYLWIKADNFTTERLVVSY